MWPLKQPAANLDMLAQLIDSRRRHPERAPRRVAGADSEHHAAGRERVDRRHRAGGDRRDPRERIGHPGPNDEPARIDRAQRERRVDVAAEHLGVVKPAVREAQFLGQRGVLVSLGVCEKDTAEVHHLPRMYIFCTASGLEVSANPFPTSAARDQSPARCGRTSLANSSSERRDLAGSIPGSGVAMMKCVHAYWRLKALNFAIHSAGVPTIMCSA